MTSPKRRLGFLSWVLIYTTLFYIVYTIMDLVGGPHSSGVIGDLTTAFMVATVSTLIELRLDRTATIRIVDGAITAVAVVAWLLISFRGGRPPKSTAGTLSLGLFSLVFSLGPELVRSAGKRLRRPSQPPDSTRQH